MTIHYGNILDVYTMHNSYPKNFNIILSDYIIRLVYHIIIYFIRNQVEFTENSRSNFTKTVLIYLQSY